LLGTHLSDDTQISLDVRGCGVAAVKIIRETVRGIENECGEDRCSRERQEITHLLVLATFGGCERTPVERE
jgi:hypothetical protein